MKYLQSLIIRISSVFAMVIGCFCLAQTVSAATITVCASGCDSTTLAGAFASGFTPGDEISVGATYDPAGDASAFPLDLHFPFTIDCHHSGAVLGQTNPTGVNYSYLPANSTIQNCNIGNFVIYANSFHPENIQILNNNFSTTATSTINFYFGAHNFLIEGNTNINAFSIGSTATSTSGIIRNNTFYFHDIGNNDLFTIDQGAQVDHLVVASNTFESHTVGTRGSGDGTLIFMSGDSNSFVTNTVRFATAPSSTMKIAVSMKGSGATVFSGNIIDAPANSPASYCAAAQFGLQSDFSTLSLTILHNTLHLPAGCGYNIGLDITDNNIAGAISADIRYNLLYRDGPIHAGQDRGIIGDKNTGSSSFSISNDYNAIYHFSRLYDDTQQSTGASLGAHTYAAKPFLRTDNISTADDYELAPFSPYLDINGTEDIGAVTGGPRRANIHIDASGIVDYSTVDATSTREIGNSLRSGDTLTLQSGVYAPITVSSTLATTTLSIIGIGSGVTIDGNLSRVDDGIFFNHVTSSVVSNLTVRNASSSHILAYSIDRVIGRHGGRTYDDDSTGSSFGSPASTTVIFAFGEHGPEPVGYGTNGYDVTSIVNGPHADGTWNDWQLALVDDGGTKLTLLIPGGLVDPSSPDLAGALSSGLGVTVDAFATSTFIYNAGDQSFTFNPSALTAAGITLASYVPAAPALTSTIGIATAGIRLDDAHGIAFSSVTSTNNGNGIRFGADSGGNTVTDSSFSSNSCKRNCYVLWTNQCIRIYGVSIGSSLYLKRGRSLSNGRWLQPLFICGSNVNVIRRDVEPYH